MKTAAGALLAALLFLPAAVSARTAGETHILNPRSTFTTKIVLGTTALPVTISGTFMETSNPDRPKPCSYDAFYVYGCFGPASPGPVFVGLEKDGFRPEQIRHLVNDAAQPPPYSPTHRYSFKLHCHISDGCGRMSFFGGNFDNPIKGSMTVEIGGEEEPASVRVDFSIVVTGRPNVPIRGSSSNLVGARLTGSGHVTFTKRQGALLVGTESKGGVVSEDVLPGGKRLRIEFGIITGTHGRALGSTYSPETNRLALLMKVKDSNDPRCPEGSFLSPTLAGLTLIPGGGARDQAVLVGAAATSLTGACKGHAHAWENGFGGVTVRVRVTRT
jgi:hypothetical protein